MPVRVLRRIKERYIHEKRDALSESPNARQGIGTGLSLFLILVSFANFQYFRQTLPKDTGRVDSYPGGQLRAFAGIYYFQGAVPMFDVGFIFPFIILIGLIIRACEILQDEARTAARIRRGEMVRPPQSQLQIWLTVLLGTFNISALVLTNLASIPESKIPVYPFLCVVWSFVFMANLLLIPRLRNRPR